ncbi:hypothetical protein MYA_0722 [Burkholderia sp. KJ006]|nr:hypothetical protein MYA_0722 [Burkholderia sp. KJ006]
MVDGRSVQGRTHGATSISARTACRAPERKRPQIRTMRARGAAA